MYLEAYSNTTKCGRIMVGLLQKALNKGLFTPEEIREVCQMAEDPIKFNDAMNQLINAAVPPGEAIVLVDNIASNDGLVCFCVKNGIRKKEDFPA